MTAFKHLLATLSVFAFGGAAQSYIQPAEAKAPISEVERACERALNANSIEALEYFLHRYPASRYRNETACYAMAMGALDQYGSGGSVDSRNNNDQGHGFYGG